MKFSIVVTAYNIEKYIEDCLNSILDQDYKENYEVIVIDDCSTDNTSSILDSYTDSKIRVYHLPKNRGVSYARNYALDNCCKGDWICMVDGDDMIKSNYLSYINDKINRSPDLDFIYVNLWIKNEITGFEGNEFNVIEEDKITNNPFELYDYFLLCTQTQVVKKEIYEGIRFPEDKWHEDIGIIHQLLLKSKKVYLCKEPLYIYRRRAGSITQTYNRKRYLDLFEMSLKEWNAVYKYLSKKALIRLGWALREISKTITLMCKRDEETDHIFKQYEIMKDFNSYIKNIMDSREN